MAFHNQSCLGYTESCVVAHDFRSNISQSESCTEDRRDPYDNYEGLHACRHDCEYRAYRRPVSWCHRALEGTALEPHTHTAVRGRRHVDRADSGRDDMSSHTCAFRNLVWTDRAVDRYDRCQCNTPDYTCACHNSSSSCTSSCTEHHPLWSSAAYI